MGSSSTCVKPVSVEVLDQVVSQLAVGKESVAVLGLALPGAEVKLVDGDRPVEPLELGAVGHPIVVVPGEMVDVPDDQEAVRGRSSAANP